ncbi:phosphoribosyltransferase-like protein [Shinella zoogloeoides]|uniref:PRTase-CE domain-containing protein n=1 Tax=Shinella zoogloeoides TaxID=352475 RepID=A0A6N8TC90_SHIZO|nr:hypothetical protein [Shinella zoogloeoides]MXO00877.1 hypothetical protein [Shinella zoogloeoides]UEX81209.1 hypothetical protein K8M09_16765 [Shinella zoogloeoides]
MAERDELLASIVETTADYREGDLAAPTPEHVERWVSQFDEHVRLPILREIDHVLKSTYFSRANTRKFLSGLFQTDSLVGEDPCKFWGGVSFLDVQGGGASQKEMLALFSKILEKRCGYSVSDCGADPHSFVYLDDASFTGNRVRQDVEGWIAKSAPKDATLHIIAIALHSNGSNYANGRIQAAAKAAGKSIKLKWWRAIALEDQLGQTNSSDVLRPTQIPEDDLVKAYVEAMTHKPRLRVPGQVGGNGIFSSDEGRQLLEQEFLKAGARIRSMCPHLNKYQRPLGNSLLETLGFGSLIVTFRNCPNNAPLALWAGDPWYPLFPRTTNSDTSMRRFMAMLAREDF